jgi:hypothetical protein
VGGHAGLRALEEIRADLDDPAAAARAHPRGHGLHEQGGALHEERELIQMVLPGDVERVQRRLRARGVGQARRRLSAAQEAPEG